MKGAPTPAVIANPGHTISSIARCGRRLNTEQKSGPAEGTHKRCHIEVYLPTVHKGLIHHNRIDMLPAGEQAPYNMAEQVGRRSNVVILVIHRKHHISCNK